LIPPALLPQLVAVTVCGAMVKYRFAVAMIAAVSVLSIEEVKPLNSCENENSQNKIRVKVNRVILIRKVV